MSNNNDSITVQYTNRDGIWFQFWWDDVLWYDDGLWFAIHVTEPHDKAHTVSRAEDTIIESDLPTLKRKMTEYANNYKNKTCKKV